MINYTTQEPLKEFNNTELEFEVSAVKDKTYNKGRPPIVKIRFTFTNQKLTPKEKIEKWCKTSEKFKKTYERLQKYKVYDEVIAKYIKDIGEKEINELLHEWDLRQLPNSKNPIISPQKFCNKVISEIGQKKQSEKNNTKQ